MPISSYIGINMGLYKVFFFFLNGILSLSQSHLAIRPSSGSTQEVLPLPGLHSRLRFRHHRRAAPGRAKADREEGGRPLGLLFWDFFRCSMMFIATLEINVIDYYTNAI